MIYAQLSVFSIYAAYITAGDEVAFIDMFRAVVDNCISQYEFEFGDIGAERKAAIKSDMNALRVVQVVELENLSYDLRIDGDGCRGTVTVDKIFLTRDSVIEQFQWAVDELNEDIDDEDEKWSVFGGFFPVTQGYEIDELFK